MSFPIDSNMPVMPAFTAAKFAHQIATNTAAQVTTQPDSYHANTQDTDFQSWKADEQHFKAFRLQQQARNSSSSDFTESGLNPFENARNGNGTFGRQQIVSPSTTGGGQRILTGVGKVVAGALATQADSPLPGPGDAMGAGLISSGAKDIGIGALQMLQSQFPGFPPSWPDPDDGDDCKRPHVLHRAVPRDERDSINFTHQFTPNPAGSMGKYFYPTQTQAEIFANSRFNDNNPVMWRATGVLPSGTPHDHITPGTEGPAIFVHNPHLSSIKHVRIRERIK